MKRIATLVLMLCFTLSGALCYASGAAGTGHEKGGVMGDYMAQGDFEKN